MEFTEMIKKFKQSHLSLGREIHKFKKISQAYVLIFFRDETAILYAACEDTYHHVKLFESIRDITEEEYRKGIGNLIKERMRFLGIKQCDLVDGCDYGRNAISSYVNGKTTPNIYILEQIASVFDCDVKDLLPKKWVLLD